MENEKIISQIKKLFELSRNNPSAEEAKSAALKAQELLVKHHIEYAEVENIDLDKKEEIDEVKVDVPAKKWKYSLAHLCADNFRCEFFLNGKYRFVFYGHKTDAEVCAETFKYLFDMGNRLGNKLAREAREKYGWADNVYNSCVMGFISGVRQALAEQSKALMVVVPEDVKEGFAQRTKGFKVMHNSGVNARRGDAYEQGRQHGYNAMKRNALEA